MDALVHYVDGIVPEVALVERVVGYSLYILHLFVCASGEKQNKDEEGNLTHKEIILLWDHNMDRLFLG